LWSRRMHLSIDALATRQIDNPPLADTLAKG
jgi:hypothetical protein